MQTHGSSIKRMSFHHSAIFKYCVFCSVGKKSIGSYCKDDLFTNFLVNGNTTDRFIIVSMIIYKGKHLYYLGPGVVNGFLHMVEGNSLMLCSYNQHYAEAW